MVPIVDGLEEKYGERMKFVRLEFDEAEPGARARALGVRVHPAVVLLRANGEVAIRFAGETPRAKLESAIRVLLGE